jgi:hypothetical protein
MIPGLTRVRTGLTFKEVLDKYGNDIVTVRPRTIRFMPRAKKLYWQVSLFSEGRTIYEKRERG